MTALVIGGDGVIGSAVARAFGDAAIATTRRKSQEAFRLDLLERVPNYFPPCDVAIICAGINGIRENEGNSRCWRTNVDGVVQVAKTLARADAFIVYVSTTAVEWSDTMYARQRAYVEAALLGFCDPAIVRPERVTRDNADAFASFIHDICEERRGGVYHWPGEK